MKMRKLLALTLTVAMCLALLAACTPDAGPAPADPVTPPTATTDPAAPTPPALPPAEPPPEGARLADVVDIISHGIAVPSIDIFTAAVGNSSPPLQLVNMFQDTFVRLVDGEFLPSLAARWETDDYQTWTFFLRDDVYFHNGDRMTAHDVYFTIEYGRDLPGMNRQLWGNIETVEVIDDFTIRFILDAVNVVFLHQLRHPSSSILSERAVTADHVEGVTIGTGPFRVGNWVSGDHLRLERFEDYWGEMPPTPVVYIRFVPEVAARTIMMMNGESQVAMEVVMEDVALFDANPDFDVINIVQTTIPIFIAFNMNQPFVSEWYFRMAVAHALERAPIAAYGWGEAGVPYEGGTIWGIGIDYYYDGIPQIPFDLDLARDFLARSSYNGEPIEMIASHPPMIRAAEMIEHQLRRIGINVDFQQLDGAGLNAASMGPDATHTMVVHWAALTSNARDMNTMVLHSTSANARSAYNNPEVDRLLDLMFTITDSDERRAIAQEVQEIVTEDIPKIILVYNTARPIQARGVGGIGHNPETTFVCFRNVFFDLDVAG